MKLSNIQILLIRLAVAGLFLSLGTDKIHEGWLTNARPLQETLASFHGSAAGIHLFYLDKIAIPYAHIWSKAMAIGETAVGLSLLFGLLARLSGILGILMVLNFYAANGSLYSLQFFGSPWSALLTAALLILVLSRAGRWAGLDALLAKVNPKGMLW